MVLLEGEAVTRNDEMCQHLPPNRVPLKLYRSSPFCRSSRLISTTKSIVFDLILKAQAATTNNQQRQHTTLAATPSFPDLIKQHDHLTKYDTIDQSISNQ
jgi:hypothetical protein